MKKNKQLEYSNNSQVFSILNGIMELRKSVRSLKQLSAEEFSKSDLGRALSNDPVWNCITDKNPSFAQTPPKKEDIENFFLLIFKFMKSDHNMNTQLQLGSMVNMAVQCNMLDKLSKQAAENMQDMDDSIKKDLAKKPDSLWSIIVPVILLVAAVAIPFAGAAFGVVSTVGLIFLGVASGAAMAGSVVVQNTKGKDDSGQDAANDTALHQAAMSVISSSMEGAQGRVKIETSTQQNASSNEQADLSMLQQMIQAQQQAFGLGKL